MRDSRKMGTKERKGKEKHSKKERREEQRRWIETLYQSCSQSLTIKILVENWAHNSNGTTYQAEESD